MSIGALFDEIPVDAFSFGSIFASKNKLMSHQRVKATMIVCHVPQLFFIFYTLVAEDRVIGATTFIY